MLRKAADTLTKKKTTPDLYGLKNYFKIFINLQVTYVRKSRCNSTLISAQYHGSPHTINRHSTLCI